MKKIIILILIIIGLIVLGFVYWQGNNKSQDQDQNQEPENMIGGQKDEHGCLIGAGYTWCESKQKCLRIWEEECVEKEIQIILAEKYQKDIDDVNITVNRSNDNYAAGSVLFGQGGPGEGGMFLAAKIDNQWQVVLQPKNFFQQTQNQI